MKQHAAVLCQKVSAILLGISFGLPNSSSSWRDYACDPLIEQSRGRTIAANNATQQFQTEAFELASSQQNNEKGNLATVQSFQTQNANVSFSGPSWKAKYVSGTLGLKPEQWLKVAFVSDTAHVQQKGVFIRVPAEQLSLVEYNAATERYSALLQGPRSGCSYARSMKPDVSKSPPGDLIVSKEPPNRISRIAEWLSIRHPVHFVWNAADGEESMTLDVDDCEYESFIANTRWLLGARWQKVVRNFKR